MVYVIGIDIGSAFSKAVVMAENEVISYQVMPSGGNYKLTAERVVKEALAKAKLSLKDIAYTVATGYGAASVPFSNHTASDISCLARGVFYLFPAARTAIDIGGQFTKVFKIDDRGKATAFLLSEKCAAGSGRFLQVIARVLQIDLKDIGELSLRSKNRVDFNTGCAVFAESEAVSRIAEGAAKEDILAGLHRTLGAKIQTMVERLGIEPDCAVVGGGAKDIGLVKSIEEGLGRKLLVPEEPQIVAALGAALVAGEKFLKGADMEKKFISQLRKIVGKDAVLTSKEDLNAYSYDGTTTWAHMPDVVVLPTTTEQVSQILKLADDNRVPVTPRGAGTNVSGGSIPIKGGVVLCTTKMNKILDINKTNLAATVEPGVVLQDFNIALAKQGLFYPPDPQSFLGCTVGGTVAENAGGPYCVKYGVTKQYVLGLEVVLANGYVMHLGGVTVKNRTGYELMMLFTGSEGTLGVITKITLRLIPMPPANKTMMAVFDDMAVGGQAVSNILGSGVVPAKVEFVDNFVLRRIEEMTPMGLPVDAKALLLLQADGSPAAVEAESAQIVDILKKSGAKEIKVAKDANEAAMYWKMRSAGFAATFGAAHTVMAEDVAVPRDKLAEFIQKLDEISQRTGFFISYLGHAGDGNLHPSIFTDVRNKEEFTRAQQAMEEIFEAALSVGGVLSGEHGIGLEKQRFLARAMDPVALNLMRKIKGILDPNNILNPGKIWEEERV